MAQIKFDTSRRYIGRDKTFGSGVWFRDANNDGKYNTGEQLINIGNRIKNSNGSYMQLNSDGTVTTIFKDGQVTKGVNLTDLDKKAMSKGLIYGRKAIRNGDTYQRSAKGKSSWDIDTNRKSQNGNATDYQGNYLATVQGKRYIGNVNTNDVIGLDDNSYSTDGGQSFKYFRRTTKSPVVRASKSPIDNTSKQALEQQTPSAGKTFIDGWVGVYNDLNNLSSRFDLTNNQSFSNRFSGVFGDLGRGIQHIAQGSVGAAAQAILPNEVNQFIGKYGQIADLGKDLRTITSGISALTGNGEFVSPWDTKNKGLVDYADVLGDPEGLQDVNDALNGATIIFGTKGAGAAKGALKGSVVADAASIAGKSAKGATKGVYTVFKEGANYAGKTTKAGLRPSNIAPMLENIKTGFKSGAMEGWQQMKSNHPGIATFSKNASNARKIYTEGYQNGRAGLTPTNIAAMYNEFTTPVKAIIQEVPTKKQYIAPKVSVKINPSKAKEGELQFDWGPKKPYETPVTTKRYFQESDGHTIKYQPTTQPSTAGVEIFNQTRQQLYNNRKPYISPTNTVLSPNEAARVMLNLEFNPAEAAINYMNQPRFNIPYIPIASKYIPKAARPSKVIPWEEAVKIKELAETAKVLKKNIKHTHNPNNKRARRHYLGGILLINDRF